MPAYPRHRIIPQGEDFFVHTISRCIPGARLCGTDPHTGKNHDHRRDWIRARSHHLSQHFAIQVCATAVTQDQFHMILWCRPSITAGWDDAEVARRWDACIGHPPGTNTPDAAAIATISPQQLSVWRHRLASVSWFIRQINQCIARRANNEDGRTGKFWDARFKSQVLAAPDIQPPS